MLADENIVLEVNGRPISPINNNNGGNRYQSALTVICQIIWKECDEAARL